MSERPKRFILAQGSMDGACFLYSVANAAKALTPTRSLREQHWSDMLQRLTRVGDFMDQQVGTGNSDPKPEQQVVMVRQMVRALSPLCEIAVYLVDEDDLTGRRLAALIDPDTVLVLGTKSHWVCAVDVDHEGRQLLVADSSQLHEVVPYAEKREGRYGRVSNNNTWSAAPQRRYYRAFRISVAR